MPQKSNVRNSLYFSERLKTKIAEVNDFAFTTVVAAMGYGKTTAVRSLLPKSGVKVLWSTVLFDSESDFWVGICNALSVLDEQASESLRKMGFPSDSVVFREFIRIFSGICSKNKGKVILVIDDYHNLNSTRADEFINLLVKSEVSNFRLVLCSRANFPRDGSDLLLGQRANRITADALRFYTDDIQRYFSLCGTEIDTERAESIGAETEGWISLIYLYMMELVEQSTLSSKSDISSLVKKLVYDPLSDEAKKLLLNVSPIADFTKNDADYLYGARSEDLLSEIVSKNSFIFYNHDEDIYHIHRIFLSCLENEFEKLKKSHQEEILRKYADLLMKNHNYVAAMKVYYGLGDFEKMIAALTLDKGVNINTEHRDMLITYMDECPIEVRKANHFAMLIYARRLFSFNERELFTSVCNEMLENINESTTLDKKEKDQLIGEYELLLSFTMYNDIAKMSEHHQKACALMSSPSKVMDPDGTWTFGSPSVLYMFHRESGKLEEHVQLIKQAMPFYYQITKRHGDGAEYAMESEMFFLRGDINNAEKSLVLSMGAAEKRDQTGIMLCAAFLQMRIALFKGDYDMIISVYKNIRDGMRRKKGYMFLHTLDLCGSWIFALLDHPEKCAEWLKNSDMKKTRLLFPAMPSANMVSAQVMLAQRQYAKLIKMSGQFMAMAGVFPNLLSKIYLLIQLAGAHNQLSEAADAEKCLNQALEIALPDKIYMPFAENIGYITLPQDTEKNIVELSKSFMYAKKQILDHELEHRNLTARENQIATLVAQGLSNKQVAEELGLAENTVKVMLKSIFKKMSVKNRVELAKLF